MLATCDDLLFGGWALWLVTATYADDRPRSAVHVAAGCWDVNNDGELIDADGHPFTVGPADDPARVILIQGPHEGVLTFGARTIRGAGALETTAADVARTPFRIGLHQTTDVTLTEAEQAQLVAETKRALADNQGVLFTNAAVEIAEYRLDSSELLVAGRQAAALDVARHMNLPGALIDAEPQGGSTLSYSNPVSRNQQWLDYGLQAFLDAVAARLSMDDVVPAGQRVAFDTSSLTSTLAPPLGAPTQD
jgi:phage portal protein BeeE